MATQERPTLLQLIEARDLWRAQLLREYSATARRLQVAYRRTLAPLQTQLSALTGEMAALDALTVARVRRLQAYADLLARMETDLNGFAQVARNEAGLLADSALQHGTNGAREMTLAQTGVLRDRVARAWTQPSADALQRFVGYVDSPAFRQRAAAFGANAAQQFSDTALALVAQGKGPTAIAQALNVWFQFPLAWANQTMRTAQLQSYRAANILSYRANAQVVRGWVWQAALGDPRTCPHCVSQHGTQHPLDEELISHHQCRCTPLPVVVGTTWADTMETGVQWFERQPEPTQRTILGPGLYDAWRQGRVSLDNLSSDYHSDVYGRMARTATLKELGVR